jgi:hypothetical protein
VSRMFDGTGDNDKAVNVTYTWRWRERETRSAECVTPLQLLLHALTALYGVLQSTDTAKCMCSVRFIYKIYVPCGYVYACT